jgi:hypothetical protein
MYNIMSAANLPRPRFDSASGGGARAGHAAAQLAVFPGSDASGSGPFPCGQLECSHARVRWLCQVHLNTHTMCDSCMSMCVVLQLESPKLFCPYVAVSLVRRQSERRCNVAITPSHLRIIACAIGFAPCLSPGMIYGHSSCRTAPCWIGSLIQLYQACSTVRMKKK